MDDIIKKLSDIEAKAVAILKDVNIQKTVISEQIEQATHTWDLEKEQETKQKIETLRLEIQSEIEERLRTQERVFQNELDSWKENYKKNKSRYLEMLFQRIIRNEV